MIRVRQIKIKIEDDNLSNLLLKIKKKINAKEDICDYKIIKKSIDARNKDEIFFVYEVDVKLKNEDVKLSDNVFKVEEENYIYPQNGEKQLNRRPIVVGSGPAGLFCAYLLAKKGYKPIIIERGEKVEDRMNTVYNFWKTGKINKESNVQFGEGGAGTFSDGKLNTLVKDSAGRMNFVYEAFVEFGASDEILYSYKPHIGTDVLTTVIKNMRNKIISLGGEFRFNTCLTEIKIVDNKISGIVVNNDQEIATDILVLAIGHSSRDTFKMLYEKNIQMEAKGFAVGLRVIHSQDMINESQYGKKYKDKLGAAPYKVTYKSSNGRGVYSFCMCPGGYVVNASSEEGRLAVNGMSYSKRDSSTANSAIIVTVFPRDFGNNPLDGIKFQRELEEKAYNLGNGNIPIQLFEDYKLFRKSNGFKNVIPNIKGNYTFSDLNLLLPTELNDAIKESMVYFGKKIKGFDNGDTIFAGVESRTSSPVKIIRNDNFTSNISGIYPCGEGAGYAGGITSAAIDGMKVAEAIIENYNSTY